jgi:hypothetical protein
MSNLINIQVSGTKIQCSKLYHKMKNIKKKKYHRERERERERESSQMKKELSLAVVTHRSGPLGWQSG